MNHFMLRVTFLMAEVLTVLVVECIMVHGITQVMYNNQCKWVDKMQGKLGSIFDYITSFYDELWVG